MGPADMDEPGPGEGDVPAGDGHDDAGAAAGDGGEVTGAAADSPAGEASAPQSTTPESTVPEGTVPESTTSESSAPGGAGPEVASRAGARLVTRYRFRLPAAILGGGRRSWPGRRAASRQSC